MAESGNRPQPSSQKKRGSFLYSPLLQQCNDLFQSQQEEIAKFYKSVVQTPFLNYPGLDTPETQFHSQIVTSRNDVSRLPPPSNFKEFYSFFEKTTYWGEITDLACISEEIELIRSFRSNPVVNTIMLDEEIYLVDLDSTRQSLDFPAEFLLDLFDPRTARQICFLSLRNGLLFKVGIRFLLYFVLHGETLDKLSFRQAQRLVPQVIKLARSNRLNYTLILTCDHHTQFTAFFRQLELEFPVKRIREEMVEYWIYLSQIPFWKQKYMKTGYLGQKILDLQAEYKKKTKHKSLVTLSGKVDSPLEDPSVLDVSAALDVPPMIAGDFNSLLPALLDTPDQLTKDVELELQNNQRTITNINQILENHFVISYDITELTEKYIALQQFLQFQEENDAFLLQLLQVLPGTFYFSYTEENINGELILIDIRGVTDLKGFEFGDRAILHAIDESPSANFRIFFIDTQTKTILESNHSLYAYFFFCDIDKDQVELLYLLKDFCDVSLSLQKYQKMPIGTVIRLSISSIGIYINDVVTFELTPTITKNFLGVWKYSGIEDEYQQIFPKNKDDDDAEQPQQEVLNSTNIEDSGGSKTGKEKVAEELNQDKDNISNLSDEGNKKSSKSSL